MEKSTHMGHHFFVRRYFFLLAFDLVSCLEWIASLNYHSRKDNLILNWELFLWDIRYHRAIDHTRSQITSATFRGVKKSYSLYKYKSYFDNYGQSLAASLYAIG